MTASAMRIAASGAPVTTSHHHLDHRRNEDQLTRAAGSLAHAFRATGHRAAVVSACSPCRWGVWLRSDATGGRISNQAGDQLPHSLSDDHARRARSVPAGAFRPVAAFWVRSPSSGAPLRVPLRRGPCLYLLDPLRGLHRAARNAAPVEIARWGGAPEIRRKFLIFCKRY